MIYTSSDKNGGLDDDPCDDWSDHPIPKPKKEKDNND